MNTHSVQTSEPLLEVRDLQVHFRAQSRMHRRQGFSVRAVDGVSFELRTGETLGLVGESGCGKSTTGRAILRLVQPDAGSIVFDGHDLTEAKGQQLKQLRRGIQAIFQDPYDSLNPRLKVKNIIAEPLVANRVARGTRKHERVLELLDMVGLSHEMADRRPSGLSGGQRQRVGIARALALRPSFVVCDEAVSALDVSVQAQVLNILRALQRELGLSYLFIGHDLAVVRYVADRVAVMYAGQLVESGASEDVYAHPYHPYTITLLASSPLADPQRERVRDSVPVAGEPPSPVNPPSGCRFHPRCPFAREICRTDAPAFAEVEPGRKVACHFWEEVRDSALSATVTGGGESADQHKVTPTRADG